MKTSFVSTLIFLTVGFSAIAQNNFDPNELAAFQTTEMSRNLQLSETQIEKVSEINELMH